MSKTHFGQSIIHDKIRNGILSNKTFEEIKYIYAARKIVTRDFISNFCRKLKKKKQFKTTFQDNTLMNTQDNTLMNTLGQYFNKHFSCNSLKNLK